ncbi:hypothetical protein NW754_001638 [Fusarium falciforme]|nr:hypothetical protein NW754_001638 [Fusarium falciforme]
MEAVPANETTPSLSKSFNESTFIAEKKYDPVLGSDHDSISSVSADDSDTGSDSGSDGDDQPRRNRMPKIRLLVQQITDQIRSLYDLSSLLRRPRIADKYIRSVSSKSHTAASDTLPLMVSFSKLDESHAIEKILQWRGLTKSGQSLSCENEPPAEERHSLATDEVGNILWYCQRLARANTRRREQLRYWADHPYVSTQDKDTSSQTLPVLVKPPVKASEIKEELGSQASTLKLPSVKFPPAGPTSTVSKQSFSTAAASDVHDTKTNARPRTVYAPTNVGQGRSNAVPGPPKTDGKATFPCPYCGITLDSSEMQRRQSWKRHVFRDLRPYICTFEHCQNPDKLYVSRHEWIYHELQIHRRKYVCKECPKTSSSRTEMLAHVQEHYGESISPAHLDVILNLCDQQDDGMNGEKEECLVCGEELSFLALQGHLAMHMEDMALFILPNTQEDQDLGGTNDSVQVEKLSHSRSQISSLGFSAPGDYGQNPADFSKLLTSEEAGYSSKLTHWKVTHDPEVASLKALVQQLGDQDEKVRHAAVKALGSQPALPYEISEAMGARLECRDRNGLTVLSWAAKNGHEVTFERLIEKGADFESKDWYSHTILHWATMGGSEAIVRMLLELGANVNSRNDDGESPLHCAARDGNEAIVRMLLELGANINSRNNDGESPLYCAAWGGNEAIVRMLLELGADFESKTEDGKSPLHYAAWNGNDAIVRILLELGADFESKTEDGKSPLHFAASNRNEAIVRMLLELGADFESKTEDGKSPLHYAASNGNEAIVRMLLELGADFESKTEDGKSPLHYAAWNGNEAIVRMLLEIGADAQMKDNRGDTALSLATGNGDEAIIQLLQQHADSPASRQSSKTYHSVPYNAGDVTAGISSAEINLNSVPTLYKKVGQDWHAVFNPKLQRDLDVDLVHVLEHSFPVTSVRFSHDGMHIATSSHRTARIFDIQTGEQVCVLDHNTPHTDHSIYISSVTFSPDDNYLATGGDHGMVCVSQFPACIQLQLN